MTGAGAVGVGTVTVRLFAAAAEAAGREEVLSRALTAAALREELAERFGGDFARILRQCALVSRGTRVDDDAEIAPGASVDVLPPFAGG